MGSLVSRAGRRISMRFNVQNRADRKIDKIRTDPNPTAAPKHESTEKIINQFRTENPQLLEAQRVKNVDLVGRLKGMEVEPERMPEVVPRRLPEDRQQVVSSDFGYHEPEQITAGRCSVRQALKFLDDHQVNPDTHTATKIAEDYTLDAEKVKHVLQHFKMFQVQVPKDVDEESVSSLRALGTKYLPGTAVK